MIKMFLIIMLPLLANCIQTPGENKDRDKNKNQLAVAAAQAAASTAKSGSSYSIGGTITGLTASGLVLQNNTADDLTVSANATTPPVVNSLFTAVNSGYWSSSGNPGVVGEAYAIQFASGGLPSYPKTATSYLRCAAD